MTDRDLLTPCTTCRETIVINSSAAQIGRSVDCPHCGTPAYIWQLIGRANREPLPPPADLGATWEGGQAVNEQTRIFRFYWVAWIYYQRLRWRGYRQAKPPQRMTGYWRRYWLVLV